MGGRELFNATPVHVTASDEDVGRWRRKMGETDGGDKCMCMCGRA